MSAIATPLHRRPLHLLLREIDRSGFVPPIRVMEEVLRRDRAETVPAVLEAMEEAFGEPWPALWFVVLLGRLGDRRAAPLLVKELGDGRLPDPWLAQAAAEALAGIGKPSLAVLPAAARSDTELCRLYAYAALGWIGGAKACALLLDALARDTEMADAVACALADAACAHAIQPLVDALSRCPPFQRTEIERQLTRLHRGEGRFSPTTIDWRLRYRPVGRRPFAAGWPGRLFSVREDARWEELRLQGPEPRTLEEILAEAEIDVGRGGGSGAGEEGGSTAHPLGDDPLRWAPELLADLCRMLDAADAAAGGTGDVFAVLADLDFKLSMSAIAGVPLLGAGAPRKERGDGMEDDDFADDPDDDLSDEPGRGSWAPAFEQHPWAVRRFLQLEGPTRRGASDGTAIVRWTGELPDNPTFDDLREDDPTYAENPGHAAVRTALRWMIDQGCEDVRVGVERLRRVAMGGRLLAPGYARGKLDPTGEVGEPGDGDDANHHRAPNDSGYRRGTGTATPALPDIDPVADVREARILAALDRYYRTWIDRPLAALGGRSPRQARSSHAGLVAKYVLGFESAEDARMRDGGVPYDFGWLRRELGMGAERARKRVGK